MREIGRVGQGKHVRGSVAKGAGIWKYHNSLSIKECLCLF